ncbi:MAG TPA: methylenetetrahydrofolate reductase [Steroidobacteraceae bacterium]|jgi:methylenetetrahydrofolate reductase (NADPH)|nr:methylenetetrahydrofolate reductase [Steroidobacteraceae bacterium]
MNAEAKVAMNAKVEPASGEVVKSRIVEFARAASTEISTHDEELVPALVNKLPAGMTVYVAHTPKASLDDVVRVAAKVQSLGFRASPHIVARRLESERALRTALGELTDAGVEQVLLVAGDREQPLKYTSTLEVIDTGALEQAGIKAAGVAGHPEGHRHVGPTVLLAALKHKQAWAERTGIKVHIATQFGFDPDAAVKWAAGLVAQGITLPVHIGIAGPTPLQKLIKFAMACGVGASLGSLAKNLSAMTNLARMKTGPDEMMVGILRGLQAHPEARIVRPHFYAFGGVMATATWMRAVMDGAFELQPDSDKFVMNA